MIQGSIGPVVEANVAFLVKKDGTISDAFNSLFVDEHVGAKVPRGFFHDSSLESRRIRVLENDEQCKERGRQVSPMQVICLKLEDPLFIELSGTEVMDSTTNTQSKSL